MKINEIFTSIEGEAKYSGIPTMFIRLSGCDVGCEKCDTKYSWDINEGTDYTINQLSRMINNESQARRVSITGGSPMLQKEEVRELISVSSKPIHIEVSGAHRFSDLDAPCVIDIKLPGLLGKDEFSYKYLFEARPHDVFKAVVGDEKDMRKLVAVIQTLRSKGLHNTIYISPLFGEIEPSALADWVMKEPFLQGDIRLQLQIHKYIWDPEQRGV